MGYAVKKLPIIPDVKLFVFGGKYDT